MNLLLHGIGRPTSDSPVHVDDALRADPGDRFDMVLTNPPFGKKSSVTIVNAEGEAERESADGRPRRLLGDDLEQAAQLRPARQDAAEDRRPRRGRRARQRAVRGRRGRDGPAPAAARVRRPHAAAPADRHLLRPGREGQRAVLRPQARLRDAVDEGAVDLRPAHQPALHAEDEPARLRATSTTSSTATSPASRRKRESRPSGSSRFTYDELMARDKASLDIFWLRDESLEDTDNLPPPERHRRRDRRGPRSRAGRVLRHRGVAQFVYRLGERLMVPRVGDAAQLRLVSRATSLFWLTQ